MWLTITKIHHNLSWPKLLNNEHFIVLCLTGYHGISLSNLFIQQICIDHLLCSRHKGCYSDTLNRASVYFQGVYSSVNETLSSINRTGSQQVHILVNSLKGTKGDPEKLYQERLTWTHGQGGLVFVAMVLRQRGQDVSVKIWV